MNYGKALAKHGLKDGDVNHLVEVLQQRANASSEVVQPRAIYHSAAVDIALGACELSEEVQAGMKSESSARHWLEILTGVSFQDV